MLNRVTVVTVYWEGEFRGRENVYSPVWVSRMRDMVAKNLSIPFDFVCLTNVGKIDDVHTIPLVGDSPGWWSKLEMFRPDLFNGPALYLDLDMVVLKNVSPLFPSENAPLKLLETFNKSAKRQKGVFNAFNSSVIGFYTEKIPNIWEFFKNSRDNWEKVYRGDQDFLGREFGDFITPYERGLVTKVRYIKKPWEKDTQHVALLCMPLKNEKLSKLYPWIGKVWRGEDGHT